MTPPPLWLILLLTILAIPGLLLLIIWPGALAFAFWPRRSLLILGKTPSARIQDSYRLCYVDGAWAFFASCHPLQVQGDDFDDRPYEHNASGPYPDKSYQLVRVAWRGNYDEPREGHLNSPWSVDDINRGDVAWLRASYGFDHQPIFAGTTLAEFRRMVRESGGEVFEPMAGPDGQVQ